jgi:transcriptional regulator with XRE-family HTH domain
MAQGSATQRLGAAIRGHRKRAGMTQEQLAELAGLAVESVSRMETGRLKNITIDVADRLAAALKVPVTALFEPVATVNRASSRPIEKRLLVMLSRLSDDDLQDVYQGLRRLLGIRARPHSKAKTRR